ncbi:hypothetical protein FRC00_010880 [Tulasnella sp. 408]|nr:hypothetical protein FRC00_010880 [Tulasnella sp. 408]
MDSLPTELQISIFEYLRKRELLSSALVCRAWRDVAWDQVMWRTFIIRLSGLLEALFNIVIWDVTDGLNGQNSDFIPLISDSNRLLAITAKATRIQLDVMLVDSLVKALLEIADSVPGKVLFPALHTLDCYLFETPHSEVAHTVFAGSPIRNILISGIHLEEPTVAPRRLLSGLLATHPQLQNVTANENYLPAIASIRSPEFWQLPDLRSLGYNGYFAYEEWAKLIQECPNLNEVQLTGNTSRPIPPNPPSVFAPLLHRLNLVDFWSYDLTIAILESTDAPQLIALSAKIQPQGLNGKMEHPSPTRARSTFRLLAERSQNLESLTLNTSIELGVTILTAFRSLRRLRITDSYPGCQLDDRGVESLCRSLPNLKEFHLDYSPSRFVDGDYARITPKSFGFFVKHCTFLTYLGLPVTATESDDFVGCILTDLAAFGENLTYLELTTLTLFARRTNDFVSFLVVQCPKLVGLHISRVKVVDRQVSDLILKQIAANMVDSFLGQVVL